MSMCKDFTGFGVLYKGSEVPRCNDYSIAIAFKSK
jgi:hypothetical protein